MEFPGVLFYLDVFRLFWSSSVGVPSVCSEFETIDQADATEMEVPSLFGKLLLLLLDLSSRMCRSVKCGPSEVRLGVPMFQMLGVPWGLVPTLFSPDFFFSSIFPIGLSVPCCQVLTVESRFLSGFFFHE